MKLSDGPVIPTLAVKDLKRAREFYEGTLGFKPGKDMGEGGVIYKAGKETALLVYPSGSAGTNQATYAGFSVDDIEETMTELREKGVKFEDYDFPGLKTENGVATYEEGGGKSAWFKDPDGNILALDEGMSGD
jgi:catechol 2,3-dioxygenase-like lactoylglutathione lyase family enzyme